MDGWQSGGQASDAQKQYDRTLPLGRDNVFGYAGAVVLESAVGVAGLCSTFCYVLCVGLSPIGYLPVPPIASPAQVSWPKESFALMPEAATLPGQGHRCIRTH